MDVFIVKVEYKTALLVSKIERAITRHGEIVSQPYLNAPDKNGYWTPCTATYVVITKDPSAQNHVNTTKKHNKIRDNMHPNRNYHNNMLKLKMFLK